MSDHPDGPLIELVANITRVAQSTGDPRINAIMDAGVQQLAQTENALPTILLQYDALLREQDEREEEEQYEGPFLKARTG